MNRKLELRNQLMEVAERVADREENIHKGVVNEIRQSADVIANSAAPSVVIANLAASFPQLRNMQAFENAQEATVRVEERLDQSLQERNALAERFNSTLRPFPTNALGSCLGFSFFDYRKDAGVNNMIDKRQNSVEDAQRSDESQCISGRDMARRLDKLLQ